MYLVALKLKIIHSLVFKREILRELVQYEIVTWDSLKKIWYHMNIVSLN